MFSPYPSSPLLLPLLLHLFSLPSPLLYYPPTWQGEESTIDKAQRRTVLPPHPQAQPRNQQKPQSSLASLARPHISLSFHLSDLDRDKFTHVFTLPLP